MSKSIKNEIKIGGSYDLKGKVEIKPKTKIATWLDVESNVEGISVYWEQNADKSKWERKHFDLSKVKNINIEINDGDVVMAEITSQDGISLRGHIKDFNIEFQELDYMKNVWEREQKGILE